MFDWLSELLQFMRGLLTSERRPRQLALGVALGVVIGLMPKANLLALGLVCLLFILRANIVSAAVTALVFTWLGLIADPVLHHFGKSVLQILPFQGWYAWLYRLPFAPWTQFNNTVVMGALFLGALQFLPTYRLAKRYFERRYGAHEDWRVRPHDETPAVVSGVNGLAHTRRIG